MRLIRERLTRIWMKIWSELDKDNIITCVDSMKKRILKLIKINIYNINKYINFYILYLIY